jgi:hypothetical protein
MELILFTHLGLGDFIFNIPIIYYLLEKKENNIHIICYEHNKNIIENFFIGSKKIKLLPFKNLSQVTNVFPNNSINYYNDKLILRSGLHATNSNIKTFPFFFYDDLNLDRNIIKTHFNIITTEKAKKLHNYILHDDYIFISNETSMGEIFDINDILIKHNIDINNKLVICSNKNIYPPNHKYFTLANKFIYKINNISIIDYKLIIENASFIILCDSSLFCFSILLELKSIKNSLIVRTNEVNWNHFLSYMDNKFIMYDNILT